eukprot:1619113-Amphidinium_carterae.1
MVIESPRTYVITCVFLSVIGNACSVQRVCEGVLSYNYDEPLSRGLSGHCPSEEPKRERWRRWYHNSARSDSASSMKLARFDAAYAAQGSDMLLLRTCRHSTRLVYKMDAVVPEVEGTVRTKVVTA